MWNPQEDKKTLEEVLSDSGLPGLLSLAQEWLKYGRYIAFAMALTLAADIAHIVIEQERKTIFVYKHWTGAGLYRIFVWIPKEQVFAAFWAHSAGFSSPHGSDNKKVATVLMEVLTYLLVLETDSEDIQALQKVLRQYEALHREHLGSNSL